MSVKHNRYRIIIGQELSRVDLNLSDGLFIIPTDRLDQLVDRLTVRILQQAAHDTIDTADGDQA